MWFRTKGFRKVSNCATFATASNMALPPRASDPGFGEPPGSGASARERLVAAGQLTPGSGTLILPKRVATALDSSTTLGDLREER